MDGGEAGGGGGGLLQQILSLRLVPRVGNGTTTYSSPLSTFPEMWYGVFLWAVVSSLAFHVPAALLALFTLRHHKYGRFMSVSVLLMGIVGPITAGTLTSTAGPGAVAIRGCLRERVGWRCSPGWRFSFWLYFPLAPRLKWLDPVSGPASGIPNVPIRCTAKGLSHF
uniref:Transmembrane protein 170A n=1 Tax=Geospiza parvula TaxID=87175 RepID=A0A8C3MAK0_GEOPR